MPYICETLVLGFGLFIYGPKLALSGFVTRQRQAQQYKTNLTTWKTYLENDDQINLFRKTVSKK